MNIAQTYTAVHGTLKKDCISDGWWHRFIARQDGKLVLRKGDNTSFLWMNAINKDTLKHYYDL